MSTQWTLNDWARVVPLMLVSAAAGYYVSRKLCAKDVCWVNKNIEKDKAKIVHTVDVEDIEPGKAKYYCRCWKSNDFPYCDGSHSKHNQETGDNVGPIGVKARA